ncbi:MAG: hypothetical protein J5523_09445 [Muribaculaceae bacterium]|nr:hypothetical protein [Muribaculaceae bacterium]
MENNQVPQAPQMPQQPPQQAPQPPYQAPQQPYQAPQQPYQAPQQPYQAPQQPYQAPQQPYQAPQQPYQQAPQAPADSRKTFKIILYVLLGLSILGGFLTFIGSFSYFGGIFNLPVLGFGALLTSLAVMAIGVVLIMRMSKNQPFGFLAVGYFALALLLNLVGMIICGSAAFSALSLILGIAGLAIAVLAVIPMNKVGDPESYKALMKEATTLDYVLLGAYALGQIITLIGALKLVKIAKAWGAL